MHELTGHGVAREPSRHDGAGSGPVAPGSFGGPDRERPVQQPETGESADEVPEEITTEGLPPESPLADDEPDQDRPPAEEDPGFEDQAGSVEEE